MCFFFFSRYFFMTDTNVSSLVLKKGSNRYIFDPSGNLDLSNYYTKSEIDTKFNNYALKTEIPDTSSLATKTELNSVKSTATTANNTANSAKTTAQNALNTANNKVGLNINKQKYTNISYTKSFTPSTNIWGRCGGGNGNNYMYQNGIEFFYVNPNFDNQTFIASAKDTLTFNYSNTVTYTTL